MTYSGDSAAGNLLLIFFQMPEAVPQAGGVKIQSGFRYYLYDYILFKLGDTSVTPAMILGFIIGFLLFIAIAVWLKGFLIRKVFAKTNFGAGTSQFVGSLVQYSIIFLGFLFCLQFVGVQLTSLSVLAGAIGVGIGFGLQNVASNFISGVIIVFERPFVVGDRIELGAIKGKVIEIGGRSTKLLNDDETVNIIPNQKLISEPVRNFRRFSDQIPQEIKIYVGYGNDARKVLSILEKVAGSHAQVLKEPKPAARFHSFDVGKLDFVLNVWRDKDLSDLDQFLSDMNVEIYEEFLKNGITTLAPVEANVNSAKPENAENSANEDSALKIG
jgi:small-conductance mechanosensitive channel